MKVLIVGSDEVWALENAYLKVFKKHCDCSLFNAHGIFLKYHKASLINKVSYRLGVSSILKKINAELLQVANSKKPDVIFIFKGMEIFPQTLVKLNEIGIKLVNYNGDHPFEHFAKGSGNKNVYDSIGLYDLHFSYSKKIVERIQKEFNIKAKWLPFGYYKSIAPDTASQLKNKVCFIGNPDNDRIRIINLLLEDGIEVDVYGSQWDKWDLKKGENLQTFPLLYKDDFNKTARDYKLHLNIFRPHNVGSHNMRTFEMPALGCVMMSPDSDEHRILFEEGKEMFFYSSEKELLLKTREALRFSIKKIRDIQSNAYERSISSGYSYNDRAEYAFTEINKLINSSNDKE